MLLNRPTREEEDEAEEAVMGGVEINSYSVLTHIESINHIAITAFGLLFVQKIAFR